MLDLTPIMQRLTQGQRAAELTPLSVPQAASDEGKGDDATGAPAATVSQPTQPPAGAGGPPDARAVADRVYEMLRADLRVFNERSGIG